MMKNKHKLYKESGKQKLKISIKTPDQKKIGGKIWRLVQDTCEGNMQKQHLFTITHVLLKFLLPWLSYTTFDSQLFSIIS